jgi:hypothetical protein
VERPNFLWDVSFTHSTSSPMITDLGLDAPIIFPLGGDAGTRAASSQAFATGHPPGVYISQVISHATRDASGRITSVEIAPGDLAPGSPFSVVGSPYPDGTQSLSTRLTLFGNWILSGMFDRVYGADLYNVSRAFRTPFATTPGTSAYGREYVYRQIESTPEQQAMIERQWHGAYIEPGDYIKFRELSLRYAVPESLASRFFGASAATVRLAGRNLHTWTDFSLLDPEVEVQGAHDNFIRGNFGVTQAPPRTLWLEVNVAM